MSSYKKGYKFEREVVEFLKAKGFYVIRSAGSKKPDIIAGNKNKIIVAECKYTSKTSIYIKEEEVKNLKNVAECFNATPVFLIKKKRSGIFIVDLKKLRKVGKCYCYEVENNGKKGSEEANSIGNFVSHNPSFRV